MNVNIFIKNYKEAFGEKAELPIVFWYSYVPSQITEKINGCFFKCMEKVRKGTPVSLDVEVISCPGGKFYSGFTDMPQFVPTFVSQKERYKGTPEMVVDFIDQVGVRKADKQYLNFARIDLISSFSTIEGILFFATPDVLSGLTSWAYFDNNSDDAVTSLFGSGCCSVVSQALVENNRNGKRTFIGLFDPSVRPYVEANVLSYMIPMSRFKEMYHTMRKSCLFETHAWSKIRERINE